MNEFSDEQKQCYNYAIRLLSRREHSEAEIQDKTHRKFGHSAQVITPVIHKLRVDNYLSDERFAEAFYRSKLNRGFGRERINQELRQKGVADHLIEQFDSEFEDELHEYSPIVKVWRKKFGRVPEDYAEKSKQMRFLKYRGFSFEEIGLFYDYMEEMKEAD